MARGGAETLTWLAVADRLPVTVGGGWRVLVALGFVLATVALAALPLRAGKRVPLAGAAAQIALVGGFTVTMIVYAAGHGLHGPAAGELAPSWAVFVLVAPVQVIRRRR